MTPEQAERVTPTPDYEPVAFWSGEAGDIYESTCDEEGYAPQEEALAEVLGALPWNSVLDVGCGFGRLVRVIAAIRPEASYSGVDVSPGQIANARRRAPNADLHIASILDFTPGDRKWDLVLSVECLLHQPPEDIGAAIARLSRWSRGHVVNCDWYEPGLDPSAWCWTHDYPALYGDRLVSQRRVGQFYPWSRESIFVAEA